MAKSINAILLVLAAVLVVPAASYAAGLGTITVRSALGQPLDAEIEVVSVQPGEDFQVRLASREAYAAAGVDLSPALQGARFAVERRDGKTLIRVRTTQPVNDPFFTVLVELQWPTGRLARQYTVLVDPAEYKTASAPAPQAAVTAPVPAVVTPPAAPTPPRTQTPIAAAKAPVAAAQPAPVVVAPATPPAPTTVAAPIAETAPVRAPAPTPVVAQPSVRTPAVEPAPAPAPVAAPTPQPAPGAIPAAQPVPVAAQAPTTAPAQPVAVTTPTPVQTVAAPTPVPAPAQPVVVAQEPTPVAAAKPVESAENRTISPSPRPAEAPVQPVAAAPTPVAAQPTPALAAPVAAAPAPSVAQASPAAPQAAPAPTAIAPLAAPSAKTQTADVSDTYQIRRGDTLGAIARKWKPEGVSYEQMLVGLFQTNRPAFIRDNINLIRAGATIFIPGREDVLAIGAGDATRQVRTHMAAFSRYRDTAVSAGTGSSGISQAQRDVVSRRVGVKKSTRAM